MSAPPPPPPSSSSPAYNQQSNNQYLPTASVPFPGSLTPGWNDPPPISSGANAAHNSGRQRLDLRKRVAYPIQSTTPNAYGAVGGATQSVYGFPSTANGQEATSGYGAPAGAQSAAYGAPPAAFGAPPAAFGAPPVAVPPNAHMSPPQQ